jgi:hypothetical protein
MGLNIFNQLISYRLVVLFYLIKMESNYHVHLYSPLADVHLIYGLAILLQQDVCINRTFLAEFFEMQGFFMSGTGFLKSKEHIYAGMPRYSEDVDLN